MDGGGDRDPHCTSWPPGWTIHTACSSRDSQELTSLDNFRGGFKPRYSVKHHPPRAQPGAHHQRAAAGCSPLGQPCRDTKRVCNLVPAAGSRRLYRRGRTPTPPPPPKPLPLFGNFQMPKSGICVEPSEPGMWEAPAFVGKAVPAVPRLLPAIRTPPPPHTRQPPAPS